jgi:hypothetical protein
MSRSMYPEKNKMIKPFYYQPYEPVDSTFNANFYGNYDGRYKLNLENFYKQKS